MESTQEVNEVELQDGKYLLSAFVSSNITLSIELEHKSDGKRWQGDFTPRYIEEITQRAGSVKSFATFVKMLQSATIPSKRKSVRVDVLTYQDLEMLKYGKKAKKGEKSSHSGANDKRYLILTYIAEFDQVHYPLPLLCEDVPESTGMTRCVQRLTRELEMVKARLRKYEPAGVHAFPMGLDPSQDTSNDFEISNNYDGQGSSLRHNGGPTNMEDAQLLPTQVLQERVQELENKLKSQGMSFKQTIATLSRKNAKLEDEISKTKAVEKALTEKLQASESQIRLLSKGMRTLSTNRTSSLQTKQANYGSPPRSWRTPDRSIFSSPPTSRCGVTGAQTPPLSPSHYYKQQRHLLSSPPYSSSSSSVPHMHQKQPWSSPSRSQKSSPKHSNTTSPRSAASKISRPHSCPVPRVRQTLEREFYPKSTPRRFVAPKASKFHETLRSHSCPNSVLGNDPIEAKYSHMISARPQPRVLRGSRSHSCPGRYAQNDSMEMERQEIGRPKPRDIPTSIFSSIVSPRGGYEPTIQERNKLRAEIRNNSGKVEDIDSRLYALHDYLKRARC